jgi:O-antigen ligase
MIALANHELFSAFYGATLFCLPIAFGVIVAASRGRGVMEQFVRFSDWLLILMTISALYGIYQYVAPPPWDTYWAQQADIEGSQGETVAFGFRIFGTLNSTGPFATALILAVVVNLSRLSLRRWYACVALIPIFIALALTAVRICWIALPIGIVCYLVLASSRKTALTSLAVLVLSVTAVTYAISILVPDASNSLSTLSSRANSLSELGYDHSTDVRKAETAEAYSESLEQPLGLGLGSVGTATKLSTGSTISLDNGFLARLVEMGFFGFALYIGGLLVALAYGFRGYTMSRQRKDGPATDLFAVNLSLQLVLLVLEAASDAHLGFSGMMFWAMVAVSSIYLMELSSAEKMSRTFSRDQPTVAFGVQ